MGIGYRDSVILYNKYTEGLQQMEYYIGIRLDNVRVEMTQGANISSSGLVNADAYTVKIPQSDKLKRKYLAPLEWKCLPQNEKNNFFTISEDDFIAVVKKEELNIDIEMPVGPVLSSGYRNGFFNYAKEKCNCFSVRTVDVFQLIPRWQIGGI